MGCSDSKFTRSSVDTGQEFISLGNHGQGRNKAQNEPYRGQMEKTAVPVHPVATSDKQNQSKSNQTKSNTLPSAPQQPEKSNIQSDSQEEESSKECPICLENNRDAVIIPCGHTTCMDCAKAIQMTKKFCPTCRGNIDSVNQLFLS